MKRVLLIPLSVLMLAVSVTARGDTDAEVQARKDALDVAAAFSNDGFKIRDGHWCGVVKPHDHSLVAVNLYAGKQMTTESYDNGERTAAGFSPQSSGQYFVSVDLLEGDQSSFCLVYSYK